MTAFSNPMSPVRDTYGFDRADRSLLPTGSPRDFGRSGPVASSAPFVSPPGIPSTPLNPYRAQNRENAAAGDAGQYAGQSFEKWYGGLAPTDAAKFAGSDPNHENAAGIQKTNARQHYMTNVLPQDPQYQQLQGTQRTARDARIAGSGVEDFQRDQADATGARNTADAIKTDAASRSTLAQGQAGELSGRGELERAQGTILLPAQARSLDAGTGAVTNDTRIKGEQWQAQKPLYPGQLQAQTDLTRADAGLKGAQADATRAQGTAAVVGAYGSANRAIPAQSGQGDPVLLSPPLTYGAPAQGSMLPTINRTPTVPKSAPPVTPGAPVPDGSQGYYWWEDPKNSGRGVATDVRTGVKTEYRNDPKLGWADPTTGIQLNSQHAPGIPLLPTSMSERYANAGTSNAPLTPSLLDKFMAGSKAAAAPGALLSPWSLLGPMGMPISAGSAFKSGFQNPRGQPQPSQPAPLPRPAQPGARLDPNTAAAFLTASRGDKNKARQMAQQMGWSF